MVLQTYKTDVILDLVFTLLTSQAIFTNYKILITKMFK
jgi:hypothetical protein